MSTDLINTIRELHRRRDLLIRSRGDLERRIQSMCKMVVGFKNDDDEKGRAAAKAEADELYRAVLDGKVSTAQAESVYRLCDVLLDQRTVYTKRIGETEKMAKPYLKQSPGWAFTEATKGFAEVGLLQVIGEAGDLANYANPGRLWKRFGLAPFAGKAASSWRREGGMSAEAWAAMGYSPKRRSAVFVLGDSLVKCGAGGLYRKVYEERKAYECARFAAEGKPVLTAAEAKKAKAKVGEYTSAMVAHRRAQRYMEKRLLRDLWRSWNGKGEQESSGGGGQTAVDDRDDYVAVPLTPATQEEEEVV